MKKTVLIVGISSFVGTNLAIAFKNDYRVVGTYHNTPVEIPGVMCLPCDVLKKDLILRIVGIIKPDFVIYAVGLSSLTECKHLPKLADSLNSSGAINCMTAAERNHVQMIYLSSAYVMEGKDVLYRESDTPYPTTDYGNTLASTEFYIQRSSLNYFILRCPVLYGRSIRSGHENYFEIMQKYFARSETYSIDGCVTTGFLDVTIMADYLRACIEKNVTNRLLQISSSDFMTRHDFAHKYAEVFKGDSSLILRKDVKFPIDNKDKSKSESTDLFFKLDPANLETFLGIKMPTIEESLKITLKRLKAVTSEKSS